jgi:hypothetical protein
MIANTAYMAIGPRQIIVQGSDWSSTVTVRDAAAAAVDITTYSFEVYAEVNGVKVAGAITKVNLPGGVLSVSFSDTQTDTFPAPALGVAQLWAEVGTTRLCVLTWNILTVPELTP